MSFLKQLRRRSKASFHSTAELKTPSHQVEVVSGKSSSTIDTSSHASITPPSSIKPTVSSPNLPSLIESNDGSSISTPLAPPPQRPGPFVTNSQRNSVVVCTRSPWKLRDGSLEKLRKLMPEFYTHREAHRRRSMGYTGPRTQARLMRQE